MTAEQDPFDHRWSPEWRSDQYERPRQQHQNALWGPLFDVRASARNDGIETARCAATDNCIWPVACALVATAGATTKVGEAFDSGCEFICSQARKAAAELAGDDLGNGGVAQ